MPDTLVGSEQFLLAVALGAAITVILATLLGFPISTTHGITGAIVGCGLVAVGKEVNFAALGKGFVLPLLLSPILAIVLGGLLYVIFRSLRIVCGVHKEWCVCVGSEERVIALPQPASILSIRAVATPVTLSIDEQENCRERYAGSMLGLSAQQVMDGAHFLSAGWSASPAD